MTLGFCSRAAVMENGWRIIGIVTMVLLLVACGCSQNPSGVENYEPGTHKRNLDLRVFGFHRSYLIHIPKNYNRADTPPLVVALHGVFSTADEMEAETGFSDLADREGFLVVYPNGITLFGWFQHWNAGHCCGRAMRDKVDDVGFISTVIEEVRRDFRVDSSRIYMVGYSNGGMLAYLFATQRPETLAAVAVIAATIGSSPSPSQLEVRIPPARAPLPVLTIHGREDDRIPYDGGRSGKKGHSYVSVKESIEFWLKADQISLAPRREVMAAGRVIKDTWGTPGSDREVILYTLEGWKHTIPTMYFTKNLPENDPVKDFHATEIIWDFFKRHHKSAGSEHGLPPQRASQGMPFLEALSDSPFLPPARFQPRGWLLKDPSRRLWLLLP
jgi:polyhydroxybutyrate depolymerase